jgi:hypothetical protein
VTTCCIWRPELITLILEILLLRGKAVVSRQASGGPRGFEQLEQFPLCVPKKILVDTVSSTKKPYGYMV